MEEVEEQQVVEEEEQVARCRRGVVSREVGAAAFIAPAVEAAEADMRQRVGCLDCSARSRSPDSTTRL